MDQVQARLDEVFAGVPLVDVRDGCTHCWPESELDLLSGDRSLISDELAGDFARECYDHWTEEQWYLGWRGLAPKILRLLPTYVDPPNLLRNLVHAGFPRWPEHERAAVRAALEAAVTTAVTTAESGDTVHTRGRRGCDMLLGAAHADHDLVPWLEFLDTLTGPRADDGIVAMALWWASDVRHGSAPILWWYPDDEMAPIRDWLYGDVLWDRLRRMDEAGDVNANQAMTDIAEM